MHLFFSESFFNFLKSIKKVKSFKFKKMPKGYPGLNSVDLLV